MSNDLFDLVRFFDELFEVDFRSVPFYLSSHNERYPALNFPPANVEIDEKRDLHFEMALAGYPQENINLDFEGDYLVLKATPPKLVNTDNITVIRKGIKTTSINNKYYVPSNKYLLEEAEATWKDGILKIKIPSKVSKDVKSLPIKVL